MPKRVIRNDGMPVAFGPYSQAVAASGEMVFISGQAGVDPRTREAPKDFEAQARQAFENVASIVAAAGLAMSDIAKTTIYLTDPTLFETLNAVFEEYFPASPPTRAVPITLLPKGLLISIEAIAVRP
jgi:reactive intermediate/imine deaminase